MTSFFLSRKEESSASHRTMSTNPRSQRPQGRSERPNHSQRPHRRTERPDRSRYHETFRCQTVREKFHSYRPNDDLRHSQDSQPMTLLYLPRNPGMMKHRPYFLINNLDGYNSTSTKINCLSSMFNGAT